jgi:hypothetical protein
MWFFEVAILEITIRFFKFVLEILPMHEDFEEVGDPDDTYADRVPNGYVKGIGLHRVRSPVCVFNTERGTPLTLLHTYDEQHRIQATGEKYTDIF